MTNLSATISTPATSGQAKSAPPPFRIGSDEHKRAFCSVLLDIFDPYKPAVLAWPNLTEDAAKRLTELPFWNMAVQTEGFASSRMQAMADQQTDPLIKEAISLNAFEEGRHKLVLRNMLRFYGIPFEDDKPYGAPKDPEWAFITTGYGECFDSFFAFGLFKMAKDSGYFPAELVDVFEPVVQEEGRHIVFFVNWVAWTAANRPLLSRLWFRARCMVALVAAGIGRISLAGAADGGKSGDNFVAAGGESLTVGLTLSKLIATCVSEDIRRMERYDKRLLRPRIMPFFANIALKFMLKS
jgi:hypothetical protein